ncbi:hypothetical protein Sjap_003679 [Stephania japonica]|uniref:NAC domain-containing protein n=1 Tax=Stephania japonica TaxID=461633 RepID=A0AAP0KQZ0_9MAGN
MAPMSLPPGFRFHPTDEELVAYYLDRKISGQVIELEIIPEVDLYKCEPWDLPDKSYLPSKDMEWYFFSPRDRKYPNGSRTNRATRAGYWKATGKDRPVHSQKREVGMKKTLVYYRGRAPHGIRTNWVMHEYRLVDSVYETVSILKDAYALCRVFKKTITPPKSKDRETAGGSEKESMWINDEDMVADDSNDNGIGQHIELQERNYEQDYSKFLSDTSSSEITQGTPIDNCLMEDRMHIPFAGDEANSLRHASPHNVDCPADPIGAVNMTSCTRLQHQALIPYPPLALEDFPHMDTIDSSKPQSIESCMMLEDVFYGNSSQDTTSAALSMQDYTYSSYYPRFIS